ncbi:MAG: GNAT family N-acetyltransferase [Clostridia bacterium]|nr:GNAT family N-acetyltransferase [Clostridia bacterium]
MTVNKLTKADYDEFIDLADLVFCQNLRKVDFEQDMPYIFKNDDINISWQYGLRNDAGKLCASVGVIPYTYKIGFASFKAAVITNVTTHTKHMGKGYMQKILDRVMHDLNENGTELVLLHGHRERYRFTGFDMAGTTFSALFKSYNIPSRLKRGEMLKFTFEEISASDTDKIRFCLDLYEKEPQGFERTSADFIPRQKTWQGKTYLVINSDGERVGYLNYYDRFGGPGIREILLENPENAADVIYAFMLEKNIPSTPVSFSPFNKALVKSIYEAAEEITLAQTNRLNLLKPEGFIEACLNLKQESGIYMPEGKLIIDCKFGKLLIENNGEKFMVAKTDETADIKIPDSELYTFLFGPLSADVPLFSDALKEKSPWFPLPFYVHATDLY